MRWSVSSREGTKGTECFFPQSSRVYFLLSIFSLRDSTRICYISLMINT